MNDDMLCAYGSEVKAGENGHLTGLLVRFSGPESPDSTGDYFTSSTDFGLENVSKVPLYFHHTLPLKSRAGKRIQVKEQIGEGTLSLAEEGILIDAIMYNHSRYKAAIEKAIKSLGWSSGSAPHLVEREVVGKATHIKRWPLGLDASLTPTPADIKNVVELKSIDIESDIELEPEAGAEGSNAAAAVPETEPETKPNEVEMTKEELEKAVTDQVAAELEARKEAEKKAAEDKAAFDAAVADGVKAATDKTAVNGGIKSANLNLKAPKGDDANTAMNHWIKTGDNGGLRANPAYKTDYNLLGGTQYQGQELVPTEIINRIWELRQPLSIARAAGAMVIPVGSRTAWVPVEKIAPEVWVVTAEEASYDLPSAQPLDKKIVSIQKYTRTVNIAEELIEDSVVDIVPWWENYIARGLALTENQEFLIGDGTSNALGIHTVTTGHTAGVTAASATAVTGPEIIQLYYSLPAEYRGGKVAWTMAPATEAAIRGLQASDFSFLPTPAGNGGLAQGTGYLVASNAAVYNSGSCPAATAALIPIVVGNFEAGYVICEHRGMTVMRDPFSGASTGQLKLHASARFGGTVANVLAFRGLTMATG